MHKDHFFAGVDCYPIDRKHRYYKMFKHFYNVFEQWGDICSIDIEELRRQVTRTGQIQEDFGKSPNFAKSHWHQVVPILEEHHKKWYAKEYLSIVKNENILYFEQKNGRVKSFDPEKSIFVVLRKIKNKKYMILTAFRPQFHSKGVYWSTEQFQQYGRQYFEEQNMRRTRSIDFYRDALYKIKKPDNAQDILNIAMLIGYARTCKENLDLLQQIQKAEKILTESKYKEEFLQSLDWNKAFDAIVDAVDEEDLEEVEHALYQFEHLVVVADVLGEVDKGLRYCQDLKNVLVWMPPHWNSLQEEASHCMQTYGIDSSMFRVWGEVQNAFISIILHQTDTQMEEEVPDWFRNIWKNLQNCISTGLDIVDDFFDNISVEQQIPEPIMGSLSQSNFWDLRFPKINHDTSIKQRVFIIDKDHRDGYDVTELWSEQQDVWSMEQSEDVIVVLLSSTQKILKEPLMILLEKPEITVTYKRFSPPK